MNKISRQKLNQLYQLIFFGAIILMLSSYIYSFKDQDILMWDEAEYAISARQIAEGDPYTSPLRPPMMGTLGAISMMITRSHDDVVLRSISLFFGLIIVISFNILIGRIANGLITLTGAICLGLMPSFWIMAGYFLSEITFMLMFFIALMYFYKALYFHPKYFHLAWLFIGFSFLTRYTALLLGPLIIIFLLIQFLFYRKRVYTTIKSLHFWLSPLWMILIISPWLIHQQIMHGDWLIGFKIASSQLDLFLPSVSMPWFYYFQKMPSIIGWPCIFLVSLGIIYIVDKKPSLGLFALIVLSFLLIWFSQYRYKEIRLISAGLPFFAIISGYGYKFLSNRISVLKSPISIGCLVIVLLASSWYTNYNQIRFSRTLGAQSLSKATDYLVNEAKSTDLILTASTPQIEWYTGLETAPLPSDITDLNDALVKSNWVALVNFERGQPAYVKESLFPNFKNRHIEDGQIQMFKGPGETATLVMKSKFLREIITELADQ